MTQFDAYIGLGDSISIDDYAGGPGRGAHEVRRAFWDALPPSALHPA